MTGVLEWGCLGSGRFFFFFECVKCALANAALVLRRQIQDSEQRRQMNPKAFGLYFHSAAVREEICRFSESTLIFLQVHPPSKIKLNNIFKPLR